MIRFLYIVLAIMIAPGLVAQDVVISEIHYHPATSEEDEFVELHNRSAAPVGIGGWEGGGECSAGGEGGQWSRPGDRRVWQGGSSTGSFRYVSYQAFGKMARPKSEVRPRRQGFLTF